MKITRFNKLNENVEEKYYIFTELIDDDFFGNQFANPKLYDNKADAINFLLNKLYNICKAYNKDLDELEEDLETVNNNIDSLLELYEQILTNDLDKPMNLSYRMVALNEPKLDEWISIRINTKKYNL